MTIRFVAFTAMPLIALAHVPAHAQDAEDPYASCAQLTDDAARLACFDTTYAEQRVVLAERAEELEEQREEVFGMREADEDIEDEELAITATVTEVLQGSRRSQVFLLDNGQLWREVDGSTMRNRVREGYVATVTRHWSGVYEMRFEGRHGYLRVARVR